MSQENTVTLEFSGSSATVATGVVGSDHVIIPKLGHHKGAGLTQLTWELPTTPPEDVVTTVQQYIHDMFDEAIALAQPTPEKRDAHPEPHFRLMYNTLVMALHRLEDSLQGMMIRDDTAVERHKVRVEVHFLTRDTPLKRSLPTSGYLWVEAVIASAKPVHPPYYSSSDRTVVLNRLVDSDEEYMLLTPQTEISTHEELRRFLISRENRSQEEQSGDGN
jgi:hypothetical protein